MTGSSTLSDYSSRRALLQALVRGGIRAGDVHGAGDRLGAHPTGDPVAPDDLVATVVHRFGIWPENLWPAQSDNGLFTYCQVRSAAWPGHPPATRHP